MPRGRAVLGGLLIAAAAVLVFAGAMSTRNHSAGYVVAARPLAAGTIIGPGDTAMATFDLPGSARRAAFRDSGVVIGRTLAVGMSPGELIQTSMLAPAGGAAALRPVSIAVEASSLAGLSPGDPVDVLASTSANSSAGNNPAANGTAANGTAGNSPAGNGTVGNPAGNSPGTAGIAVVLRGAALLSVSRPGSGLAPLSGAGSVVTLGVSTLREAEMLVQASHSGTVILVQATPSDGVGPGPGPAG